MGIGWSSITRMTSRAYERPDYEPAPARPTNSDPAFALGYVVGEPFEPITIRPGILGLLDRFERAHRRQPALNECGQCGMPTPGYSWCSHECLDQHTRESPEG